MIGRRVRVSVMRFATNFTAPLALYVTAFSALALPTVAVTLVEAS